MEKHLPATPADALEISPALRLVMRAVYTCADIFRFWSAPAAGAATDFAEMNLLDKLYWAYKCRRPVVKAEPGSGADRFEKCALHLPSDFRKTHTLTLGAAGDLIGAEGLENSRDLLYAKVDDLLFTRDISYANLEPLLTGGELVREVISDKESPIECCSREQFAAMKGHRGRNFTVLHTAGNHTADLGPEGIETTLAQLDRDRIVDIGTNRDPADYGRGKIIHCNGFRIGFASATFGLNGKQLPKGSEYLINVARLLPRDGKSDLSLLKRQIDSCRSEGCDFVIASLHWGYEFEFFPRQRQVDIAHTLAEWGADLIIGHHPHVVQPVEHYRTRRDPDRIVVIAYSLGTLTWSFSAPHLVLSAILDISLVKGSAGDTERTYIEKASVVPVFRTYAADGENLVMRIEKLADFAAADDREAAEYLSAIRRYAALVFGEGGESPPNGPGEKVASSRVKND